MRFSMVAPLLVVASSAWAADALTFQAVTTVAIGDNPSVTFHPSVSGHLQVSVACAGEKWSMEQGISPGKSVTLSLTGLPEGRHACNGQVRLQASDGSDGTMPLALNVAILGIVDLSATLEDVDLVNGTLRVRTSREVSEAVVDFYGVRGAHLGGVNGVVVGAGELQFSWTPSSDEIVKLTVQTRDDAGFTSQLDLWPWFYEIPHEDVIFASGSHDIGSDEAPKLERSWAEIVQVMELYGSVVDMKLFVAGYTDTVGAAAGNLALSERRARSIAGWFRQRGFSLPIRYQGFGETVLAVGTSDETDEIRNRRAVYVLAAQAPPRSDNIPNNRWTPLR